MGFHGNIMGIVGDVQMIGDDRRFNGINGYFMSDPLDTLWLCQQFAIDSMTQLKVREFSQFSH